MRGGLARLPGPSRTGAVHSTPPPHSRSWKLGDGFFRVPLRLRDVAWSATYAGFVIYVFVITTYALRIGDYAVVLALGGLLVQRGGIRFSPLLWTFLALLIWITIGYFQSPFPGAVLPELQNFAKLGLILVAATNALQTRSQLRFFIVFWLGCYALYPVRGTYVNYFIGGYTTFGRALWNYVYANPNDLAALTLLQLGLCVGVLVTEPKGWLKRAALIGVGMLVLLVFLTQSRGAFLGLVVFGLLSLLAGQRRRIRSLSLFAVVALVVYVWAPDSVWDRLGGLARATDTENLAEVDEEGSAEQRYQIWQTAYQIIADHPIFGVGWGAYPLANEQYAPMDGSEELKLGARDTHSTYLNVVAETGYPGLLIFSVLVFGTLVRVDLIRRRCKPLLPQASQQLLYLELGLLAYMVSGIFGSYSRLSFLYIFLALMWALAKACESDLQAVRRIRASAGPLELGVG